MNRILGSLPDSTGGLEPSEPAERALARAIVADAVDRYLEATRARIAPFVDDHFSFSSAWALHRRALGRDLLRAPVNVMLVLPQLARLPQLSHDFDDFSSFDSCSSLISLSPIFVTPL